MIPALWLSGYAAAIRDALTDPRFAINPKGLDPDFIAGHEAAKVRAAAIATMRDEDPLEFTRHYGSRLLTFQVASAYASDAARVAWGEREARHAELSGYAAEIDADAAEDAQETRAIAWAFDDAREAQAKRA